MANTAGQQMDLAAPLVQDVFNRSLTPGLGGAWTPLYAHRWRRGVLGCATSHLAVWHALAHSSGGDTDRYWIVLEDDVEFGPEFASRLQHVLGGSAAGQRQHGRGWGLLYLGWTDDRPVYKDTAVKGQVGAVRLSTQPRSFGGGTFGYVIRPAAASAWP